MAVHERAKVLLFVPYATKARVCCTAYVNPLPHDDTGYVIADLNGVAQAFGTIGSGLTNFNVTGLSLTIGETFTCRVQYHNPSGVSTWSTVLTAKVFSGGFDLTPIIAPALPGATSAPLPLSIPPSYQADISITRGLLTHTSEAGHRVRRLTSEEGTRTVRLQWFGLTQSQRDVIVAVIEDSPGSYDTSEVRGFDFSGVSPAPPRPLADVSFLPLRGTIITREITSGVFEVIIDATEIRP